MMKNLTSLLIVAFLALVLLSSSAFTVNQTQYVLVQRLGEIVAVKKEVEKIRQGMR